MDVPIIIGFIGPIYVALIAGIVALWRRNGSRNDKNNSSLERIVGSLNKLHDDIKEALQEGREEHRRINEALIRLLERGEK